MFRLISVLSLGFFVNSAFAEEPADTSFDIDLEAIHAAPAAEDTKAETHKASFNALDEEEDFSMDLSSVAPTQPAIDPDAELEPIAETVGSLAPTGNITLTPQKDAGFQMEEDLEIEPAKVDAAAKNIDWNLDLSEDMEIGNTKISAEEEKKSEAVDLGFLEE